MIKQFSKNFKLNSKIYIMTLLISNVILIIIRNQNLNIKDL